MRRAHTGVQASKHSSSGDRSIAGQGPGQWAMGIGARGSDGGGRGGSSPRTRPGRRGGVRSLITIKWSRHARRIERTSRSAIAFARPGAGPHLHPQRRHDQSYYGDGRGSGRTAPLSSERQVTAARAPRRSVRGPVVQSWNEVPAFASEAEEPSGGRLTRSGRGSWKTSGPPARSTRIYRRPRRGSRG